jgi:hypothetical protein
MAKDEELYRLATKVSGKFTTAPVNGSVPIREQFMRRDVAKAHTLVAEGDEKDRREMRAVLRVWADEA